MKMVTKEEVEKAQVEWHAAAEDALNQYMKLKDEK